MKNGPRLRYVTLIKDFSPIDCQSYLTAEVIKMKTFLCIFLILSSAYVGTSLEYRGLFSNWFNGGAQSPCNGCPFRNCLSDRAVILGYCCGCARVSDFLPIECQALRLNCPHDGRRLCRDYDYMLNCCCP